MRHKKLENINLDDLKSLIDNKVMENKQIEYKQKISLTPSDKREFLADVSSFANSNGGDIIYGIKEDSKTGEPIELSGLEVENIDSLILQIENIFRDSISPRIWGIQIHYVKLPNSNIILIIRIPNSWTSPHRVDFKGHHKFYTRGTNGKYAMDVDELRIAFNLSQNLSKQIEAFRLDRINKIYSNDVELPLKDEAMIVLHIIPFSAFSITTNHNLQNIEQLIPKLRPMTSGGFGKQYTLQGFLCYFQNSYTQLLRNGIIEAVDNHVLTPYDRKIIPSTSVEETILESYSSYKEALKLKNITPPLVIMVSLLKIKEYEFAGGDYSPIFGRKYPHGKDILNLPPNVIQNFNNTPSQDLRPIFDSLWNSYGFPKSKNFDKNGKWYKS